MSINKIILVGNLGKDPELRKTPAGMSVCTFPLATTERFKDRDGQQQDKTEWHNILAWAGLADVCGKYLHKGKQIYCEGKIQTRSYDDRDGNKRYTTEIVISNMQMLGKVDKQEEEDPATFFERIAKEQSSPSLTVLTSSVIVDEIEKSPF